MGTGILITLAIIAYLLIGLTLAISDFLAKPKNSNVVFLSRPRFINDRSISTALIFVVAWPYKLARRSN